MNSLLLSVFQNSLNSSIIIIIGLIMSIALGKHYTSKYKYILWLIITIRLILPLNLLTITEAKIVFQPEILQ